MIFWPSSPRACAIEDAEAIGSELHRRLELVGVFVNAPLDEVAATADLARLHPARPPVVLSGGLNADNVGQAIDAGRPFAVDVASGTEAEPGRKDPAKLTAFVRAVAAADERLGAAVREGPGPARTGARPS